MLREMARKIPGARKVAQTFGLLRTDPDPRKFLLDMLPRNSVGAEIGVHKGDFSRRLLNAVNPRELHLIDPWRHESSEAYREAWYGGLAKEGQEEMDARHAGVCARFDEEIRSGRVRVHRGDSSSVLPQFPDASLDWVYIDGNHLYDYVKADIELSLKKTKVGGYITGDDYTEGGWWEGGVKRAVDEYAKTRWVELIVVRNAQFVFRKRK